MKKLIVGMIAALLVMGGLVSATQTSASAAPYPGTVRTKTIAAGVHARPHHAIIYVKVTSYGHGAPTGHVSFTFVNKSNGKVYTFDRAYSGSPAKYHFGGLSAGTYAVSVVFTPPDGSKYKASAAKCGVKVSG